MLKRLHLDYTILTVLFLLGVVSTLLIYSATRDSMPTLYIDQMVFYAVLYGFLFVMSLFRVRNIIYPLVYVYYGLGIVSLVLVLLVGITKFGATSWFDLGFMEFQPSEPVKLLMILAIAKLLAKREGAPLRFWYDAVPALLLMLVPFALIYKQPDLGTSMVYIAIFLGMIWVGNIRKKHVLIVIAVIVAVIGLLVALYFTAPALFDKIIKPHQMERIMTFLDQEAEGSDDYHIDRAMLAISIGQLAGKGFLNGEVVHKVPVVYSDSIFTAVGEEFGFIGSSLLLLLFFMLIYRMIYIALECKDLFNRYVILGIATMISFQTVVNVGMHLGMLPFTGLPLPFISYGRSSLLMYMISMGIVLSFYNQEMNEER